MSRSSSRLARASWFQRRFRVRGYRVRPLALDASSFTMGLFVPSIALAGVFTDGTPGILDVGGDKDGGTTIVDINNDGFLDVLVNRSGQGGFIFLNDGDTNGNGVGNNTFTDITPAGFSVALERSMIVADINNCLLYTSDAADE